MNQWFLSFLLVIGILTKAFLELPVYPENVELLIPLFQLHKLLGLQVYAKEWQACLLSRVSKRGLEFWEQPAHDQALNFWHSF